MGVSILAAVLVAVLLKVVHLFVSGAIAVQQGKAHLKVNYSVVQQPKLADGSKASKPRVLVTGGCGFLGRHIVDLLTQRFSDKLSICVLDWQAQPNPQHPDVQYIVGDVRVPAHVRSALSGAAAVIHAAVVQETATTEISLMQGVNVEGTRSMLEACLDQEVKVLLYTSSVLVHFAKDSGSLSQITEEHTPPPEAALASRCAASQRAAERMVLAANSHIIRTAVLRNGILLGAGEQGVVDQVFDHSTRRAMAAVAGRDQAAAAHMLPYCWVCDAAHGAVMALVKLLLPNDEEAAQLAALPWWPAAGLGPEEADEYVHVANPVSAGHTTTGKVAGQVLHLCFDPDAEKERAAVGLGGLDDLPHQSQGLLLLPLSLQMLQLLARWNERVGRRLGFAPFGRRLTQASVQLAQHPGGLFGVGHAYAALGWQPTSWQQVQQLVRSAVTAGHAKSAAAAAAAAAAAVPVVDKKTQ